MILRGRTFVFGDNIDTDVLAPGIYMKGPVSVMAEHCLEAIDPDFAKTVRPGDLVVAGRGFGIGSSREQAAEVLKLLGVSAVIAISFGGIFYRNALNFGLPLIVSTDTGKVCAGDILNVDPTSGEIRNETSGATLQGEKLPRFLMDMVEDGGLIPHLERRLAKC